MAEGTKITAARAAAYAAFAFAASFVGVFAVAYLLSVCGAANCGVGLQGRRLVVSAIALALAILPLATTWLMSRISWPKTRSLLIRFPSVLLNWLIAGCSLLLGAMTLGGLIEGATGGDRGTNVMAFVILMFAAWPLVLAMAIAALLSWVARPTGRLTFLYVVLAVASGSFSLFFGFWPLLATVGAVAAWWWAVGMELWRLDAHGGAGG